MPPRKAAGTTKAAPTTVVAEPKPETEPSPPIAEATVRLVPEIVAPTLPTTFTPTTIIAYASAAALFLLGILTSVGVVLPAAVSADVAVVVGAAMSLSALIVPLVVLITKHGVTKAAIAAGYPIEKARRL